MTIYDLNGYKQNTKTYGGTAGVKIGLTINGTDYLVKYPGKLKYANMKNVEIDYSNSPVCEYIGCRIYQSIGLPTQGVWLGERNGKIVVLCQDFLQRGDSLIPFRDIRATFEPAFTDPQGDITNGTGTNLNDILRTLKEHPLVAQIPELRERFWDMFVIDALIGNPDRNNENWGLIRDLEGEYRLAPVYDCGNSLNCKLSERQMAEYLSNAQKLEEAAIQRPCIYERGPNKRINAYQFIQNLGNEECNEAVKRVVPHMDMNRIRDIVNEIPDKILGDTTKIFYQKLIELRYDQVLEPALEKLQSLEKECQEEIEQEEEWER